MRDDFEASFEEQRLAIQAEAPAERPDADPLPAVLSETSASTPFCFGYPAPLSGGADLASILDGLNWDTASRQRARTIVTDYCDLHATREAMLGGVDDQAQLGIARILGVLVCAEESAVNIFHHETGRLDAERASSLQRPLREIESEERVHDWLIQQARRYFPQPDDIDAVRRRTKRLFMRVASRDLGEHFARITGLDSGVCISLSALLGSPKVRRAAGFARLIRHIRHDEATHVRKSRDHAVELGFDPRHFRECYDLTRVGMVEMLRPIASSFEALDVDPEKLFARLLRYQGERDQGGEALLD